MLVLLDLDGVLADFLGGCLQQHGWNDLDPAKVQWEFWHGKGMSDADFWESKDFNFWVNLPKTVDGLEILNVVERQVGRHNVFICSSPCLTRGCTAGKALWVEEHLPAGYSQRLFLTGRKEVFAGPRKVLVDDNDDNLNRFASAGGNVCCVPRPWNLIGQLGHPVVETVAKRLERIMQK